MKNPSRNLHRNACTVILIVMMFAAIASADEEPLAAPADSEQRLAAIPVFNEGVDALQAKDNTTALVKFQQAAELDPEFMDAYRGIAAVALELEQYEIAADAAENMLKLDPTNDDAVGTAYYADFMAGNTKRMVVSADRLARTDPEVVSDEMLQHATVAFGQNAIEQARALLEVIVSHQPDLAEAQLQLGLVCNSLGDVECAKPALNRFLELAPDDPESTTARSILEYLTSS